MAICKGAETDHSEPNWQSEVFHLVICLTDVLQIVHCAKTFYCRIMITEQNKTNLSRRLRVLFVISDLSGGGAERAVSTYLHHLDRSRFEPGLCLWRDIRAYPVPEDVPVWVTGKSKSWHTPLTILKMARLVKRWQPDIVLSQLRYVNLLTGFACAISRQHACWIPSIQNNPENEDAVRINSLLMPLMKRASKVVTVSHGIETQLIERFHFPKENVTVMYNPVDFGPIEAEYPVRDDDKNADLRIVTMGRLTRQKDHRTLLQAVARVSRDHNVKLIILGEGPMRNELESFAAALGIQQSVEFRGFISNPFGIIKGADIFVLSSKWEGHPLALMEAMACATTAIATRCPTGPEEIIENGENGILVPVEDDEALSRAIVNFLSDEAKRERLAKEGYERVKKQFGIECRTQALENLFLSVAGCHR